MKLIKAKQPGLARQVARDKLDRIGAGILAELHPLPKRVNALMHIEHEFVKMGAPLPQHQARLKEQIHEHGFAAADVAADIEALDLRLRFFATAEHPSKRRRFSRQATLGNLRFEPRQPVNDSKLDGVGLDQAAGHAGGVSRLD